MPRSRRQQHGVVRFLGAEHIEVERCDLLRRLLQLLHLSQLLQPYLSLLLPVAFRLQPAQFFLSVEFSVEWSSHPYRLQEGPPVVKFVQKGPIVEEEREQPD